MSTIEKKNITKQVIKNCFVDLFLSSEAEENMSMIQVRKLLFDEINYFSSLKLLAADSSSICPNVVVCCCLSVVIKLKNAC